jgi:hypothetical protein
MKRLISAFALFTIFITACTPTATTQISQPSLTPIVSEQSTVTPEALPTEQIQTQATKKPKDKNPLTAPTSTNTDFIATEILGRPTNTAITVNVVPAIAMTIYYKYGTASGNYISQTAPQSAAANMPLETLIDKLQPNTRYYYRINYNGAVGAEHSFMTQRAVGSAFTFDIQGDSHPERVKNQFDTNLYTRTLQSAAADQPDFYMTIGDDFSVDTLKNVNAETVPALYINQRQWLGLVGAPVFLVNGNHEQASMANLDGTADNVAVWAQTARNAYYPQPAPDSLLCLYMG